MLFHITIWLSYLWQNVSQANKIIGIGKRKAETHSIQTKIPSICICGNFFVVSFQVEDHFFASKELLSTTGQKNYYVYVQNFFSPNIKNNSIRIQPFRD